MKNPQGYILSIDQSTSATKVMLFDHAARLAGRVSIPHNQFYPEPGFVEHDAAEIFINTISGAEALILKTGIRKEEIACISITNQRETTLMWDRHTGKPLSNAAVWQCRRGMGICEELKRAGYDGMIRKKTGLLADPYFSASKLRWMMKNIPGAKERAGRGDLLLGTIDSWLLWNLTGRKVHATDHSNASRTMLFNINTLKWDSELVNLFELYPSMFPEIKFSDEIFGNVAPEFGSLAGIPVAGLIGDSHGALFGQHCFSPGMTKATYGTGSSIMMNIGKSPADAPEGLVTSIGFSRDNSVDYVFEGNIHCTGDTINWLINELKLIQSPAEAETMARSVTGTEGVYFVPAFVGLGAPYWDSDARAGICGMNRNTSKAHIVRAALESIAYQVRDLISLMTERSGIMTRELRVDGGPAGNDFLMQFQADILDTNIVRAGIEEISALGSAFMAGLAFGFWRDIEEIGKLRIVDKTFTGRMPSAEIEALYNGWLLAVKRMRMKE